MPAKRSAASTQWPRWKITFLAKAQALLACPLRPFPGPPLHSAQHTVTLTQLPWASPADACDQVSAGATRSLGQLPGRHTRYPVGDLSYQMHNLIAAHSSGGVGRMRGGRPGGGEVGRPWGLTGIEGDPVSWVA